MIWTFNYYTQYYGVKNMLDEIRKPTFQGKETINSVTLLPLFNFIGEIKRMKSLRNVYLTKVKRNFFLFLRAGTFYGFKNKKIYNNHNSYCILWWIL